MSRSLHKFIALSIVISSFFFFIDDKYRGWNDTHLYLIEAQSWAQKTPPPTKEILQSQDIRKTATHTPPLTAYLWSFLFSSNKTTSGFLKVRIFQAMIISLSFLFLITLLSRKNKFIDALCIGIILFINGFFREQILEPISEPLSIFLLLLPYKFESLTGVTIALQLVTRPVVCILHIPRLLKKVKDKSTYLLAILILTFSFFKFGSLIVPTTFGEMGAGFKDPWSIWSSLVSTSAFYLFDHLLPYKNQYFLMAWGSFIAFLFLAILFLKRRDFVFLFTTLTYGFFLFLPYAQGVRYFILLFVFWLAEIKPSLPKTWVLRGACLVLSLHLCMRQLETIKEHFKYPIPDSESEALMLSKKWIEQNTSLEDVLIMEKFRYCINFYKRPCLPPPSGANVVDALKATKARHLVFTELYWIREERDYEIALHRDLTKRGISLEKVCADFDGVYICDIQKL